MFDTLSSSTAETSGLGEAEQALYVCAQSHMLTCIAVLTCGHTRAHTPHKRAQC